MVRTEGADKRGTARFLAYGVNGLSVALMIVVFAHTAGITGAEAGIAGGSAVLGQKLLEAVFGDQAVRSLAERARRDLERRVADLLDAERRRYTDLLDALGIDAGAPDRLRDAARRVEDLRFAMSRAGRESPLSPARTHRLDAHCTTAAEGEHDGLARGGEEAGRPGVRPRRPDRGTRRGRRRRPRTPRRRARGRGARRPRTAPPPGSGCPPTTRSWRSPARPGSGKSSTYNWLTGLDLSAVGVRRPTTSWATACVWGSEGASELLEWLGIPARHQVMRDSMLDTRREDQQPRGRRPARPARPRLDRALPTTSRSTGSSSSPTCWCGSSTRRSTPTPRSTTATSRRTPRHQDVMLVVLNQIDTVPEGERDSMVADVRRLLDDEGLERGAAARRQRPRGRWHGRAQGRGRRAGGRQEVVAGPGRGRREGRRRPARGGVRDRRRRESCRRSAWQRSRTRSPTPPACRPSSRPPRQSARIRAQRATGWPVTRVFSLFRPDPLKRLDLDLGSAGRHLSGRGPEVGAGADAGGEGPGRRRGPRARRRRVRRADPPVGARRSARRRRRACPTWPAGSTARSPAPTWASRRSRGGPGWCGCCSGC